jgi:HEPN domain-containing protein
MAELTTKVEIAASDLEIIAEARLREFALLRAAGEYAGAYYLGGYAVELYLKRAICRLLGLSRLPVLFHIHDLDALLFFAGLSGRIDTEPHIKACFNLLRSAWSERKRYTVPAGVTAQDCDDMDRWLNDPSDGVIPWLRRVK